MRALARRPPEEQHALRVPKLPDVYFAVRPRCAQPELVVGAAGDREVALPRIERPLEDAQRLDQLGDDEVRVGVAVAVEVARLVDRDAADGELDVLPFARVEAAQEDLLGVPLAALVGEQDPRRELEEVGRVARGDLRQLADADLEVGGAAARRRPAAEHGDVDRRCLSLAPARGRLLEALAPPSGTATGSGAARRGVAGEAACGAAGAPVGGGDGGRLEVKQQLDAAGDRRAVAERPAETASASRPSARRDRARAPLPSPARRR